MSQLALDLIRQAKREGWKSFDISSTGVLEIPQEVMELTELEEFHLNNCIHYDEVRQLKKEEEDKLNAVTDNLEHV